VDSEVLDPDMSPVASVSPIAHRYPSHDEQVRQRLQDAALECVREVGFNKVSMREIAERAGIVRQTVYNYYPNKHKLVGEAFLREGAELAQDIAGHIRQFDSVEDKFVETFIYVVEQIPRNPILALMVEPGNEFLSTMRMDLPFNLFGQVVFEDVFRAHPSLADQAEEIGEFWSRNALSFLTFHTDKERSREDLEAYVRRRLIPGLHLSGI
jgi:AcrR family transcriptional regulator